MEIEIEKAGKIVNIECKNPKGRHTKKGLKLLFSVQNEDGSENIKAVENYTDYLDNITAELTGMTIDELDDLDSDEKNKLVSYYDQKIQSRLDFLKSSQK